MGRHRGRPLREQWALWRTHEIRWLQPRSVENPVVFDPLGWASGWWQDRTLEPGFPFWPSRHGQHSRSTAAVQRSSRCLRSIFLSSPVRPSDRSGQGVPAAPGGPSADTTPTLPLGNSPLRLLGARRVILPAQAAPRSSPASRRTASGSDALRPRATSSRVLGLEGTENRLKQKTRD